jgi:hypothetical protein
VSDQRFGVFVRLEVREHPVGERARIATLGPADSDPKPQELLGLQVLSDRAQPVVSCEPATEP